MNIGVSIRNVSLYTPSFPMYTEIINRKKYYKIVRLLITVRPYSLLFDEIDKYLLHGIETTPTVAVLSMKRASDIRTKFTSKP